MAYNPGVLNPNIITQGVRESKIDLATPVNLYTTLQANKRQQKLADLTLSQEEKKAKRQQQYQKILQGSLNPNGFIDSEKAVQGLNQAGLFEEAAEIRNRQLKKFDAEQKKQQATALMKGQMAEAVLNAPNQVEAFMLAKEDAKKIGLPLSDGLLNYIPTDEEIQDGRLDPKVNTELKYYSEKILTPEQRIAKAKAEKKELESKEYGLAPIYGKKGNNIVAFQTSKSGDLKQINIPEGVTLTPGLQYQNIGDKIVGFDKSGTPVLSIKKGIEPGKGKELEFKEEEFEEKRKKWKMDFEKTKQKNKSSIDKFSRFSRKARKLASDPNLKYITGQGRYNPLYGSSVPVVNTVGKDLKSELDNLIAMGSINTMIQLKQESKTGSTGFGALSAPELQILKDALGSIENPDVSPKQKKKILLDVANIVDKYQDSIENFEKEFDIGEPKTEEETLLEGIDEL